MAIWKMMLGCVALAMALPAAAQPADDVWYAWSPKPDKLPAYGSNTPVTRLPAVLAKHNDLYRRHGRFATQSPY